MEGRRVQSGRRKRQQAKQIAHHSQVSRIGRANTVRGRSLADFCVFWTPGDEKPVPANELLKMQL